MQSGKSWLALRASIPAIFLSVACANAQFSTTFVNQLTGDNANPCGSPNAPCATIGTAGGALAKTSELGVIHVAPGEYQAFTVDKSVEIVVDGGQATIAGSSLGYATGSAGIIVEADATDKVRIRGFLFDGALANADGVAFVAGGSLQLEDCAFVNGENFGVIAFPTTASELYVSRSTFSGAVGGGIQIKPTGSGGVSALFENVLMENNASGITIDGRSTTGNNSVTIRNSVVSGNSAFGIYAADSGGGSTNVVVEGSTSANNGTFGIGSNGVNSFVRVRNSTVTGNGTGLQIASSGKLISNGGNVVRGNTANGAFTATEAQQ